MEPLLSLLIPAITETVFGALAEAAGLSDWLRQRLGRDCAAHAFLSCDLRYFTEILHLKRMVK